MQSDEARERLEAQKNAPEQALSVAAKAHYANTLAADDAKPYRFDEAVTQHAPRGDEDLVAGGEPRGVVQGHADRSNRQDLLCCCPAGWAWQPSRLKGIQVSPEHGTPFLAATQVFDVRPVPRKWLSLNRTNDHVQRFVHEGTILLTCSGIRLLLLTGCRLREILHLRWNEVDLERGLLNLPDSKTGRKTVYLSNAAIDVFENLPRAGVFVVAGDDPKKPRADLKRPWKRISEHAGIADVRIHDLRHTFASIGAAQGLSLQVIGKLLGHKSPETTARYAHLTEDPLRRALNDMSDSLPFGRKDE